MAIRYSGDVEVRMLHKGGTLFAVTVRTPRGRWATDVDIGGSKIRKVTPEDYDRVALTILRACDQKRPRGFPFERDAKGGVMIRRIFQAPCPVK